jgi:hypothetical protein
MLMHVREHVPVYRQEVDQSRHAIAWLSTDLMPSQVYVMYKLTANERCMMKNSIFTICTTLFRQDGSSSSETKI